MPLIIQSENIKEKFEELSNKWHQETSHHSAPSKITGNEYYLKIISLGILVIPLILKDLQDHGGDWFLALRVLSDTDVVSEEYRGNYQKMRESWLNWGRKYGYVH